MGMRWGWCVWMLLAWPAAAQRLPETPQFRHVGVAEGLPSSSTRGLALDRDGYLWIATGDGLVRYDGVGYTVFRYAPGDPASLPGNAVRTVFVDAQDRVWAAIEGQGLAVLDKDRRGFRRLGRRNLPALHNDEILAIAQTPDGRLWFGSEGGGLFRMDAGGRIRRYLPSATVHALGVDGQGALWIGTDSGAGRWDGSRVDMLATPASPVLALSAEADGTLWMGTADGLWARRGDGMTGRPDCADDAALRGAVTAVLRDSAGTRWIGTRRGLAMERAGVVRDLGAQLGGPRQVRQLLEDREGGLWVSSSDGLLHLPAGWRQFAVFGAGSTGGLSALPVRGMAPARDGGAWLVTGRPVADRLDLASGRVEHALDLSAERPGAQLCSVLEQQDGTLWLGHSRGLSRRDAQGRRWRHWGPGDAHAAVGAVHQMLEAGDGLVWLKLSDRELQARAADGTVVHRVSLAQAGGRDAPDRDRLALGPDGAPWLAGQDGLRRWDGGSAGFVAVPGAGADRVFGFAVVPPDTVWLHRLDQIEGYRWDGRALARFRTLGPDSGLPAVESGGLMADRSGLLWLATVRGLWRYDPVGDRLRRFGMRDGLPDQEFALNPPVMLAQGFALASTRGGVVLFDPARVRGMHAPPRLRFEGVSLRRGEDQVSLDPAAGRLTMQPQDRDLHVGARLLSFSDPGAHRYRFWLHGYDADWVSVGPQGERDFSRLEPGAYRLEVAASDAEGEWSAPLQFELKVQAPWWRQTRAQWAAGGSLALLALLSGLAYRRRLRQRHARQLREQQRQLSDQGSEAKSRFLAMLGHEIRTPMTGVLGMAELLQGSELSPRQRRQVDAIQRAGEHLLHLVNDALDLARIESGKLTLDARAFDLHALVDDVSHLLQPLAAAKGLHFSLQRAPGTPRALRGDAVRLRQILLNLGTNAIKFTDHGEVALRTAGTPQGLLLELSDTGPGMDEDQVARLFQRFEQGEGLQAAKRRAGSGLGLAICQELAHAMGGQIDVQSRPGQGTCLRVRLPLPVAELDELLPEQARRPPRSARALRVLVVEDDPTVASVVTGLLEFLGHEAVHASQGLAALTELAQSRFDLALLDLDLPGLDGFELARIIRSQGHALALVALTARSDPHAEAQAMAAGMHGFLRKPVTSELLQEKMERVLCAYRLGASGPQPALA